MSCPKSCSGCIYPRDVILTLQQSGALAVSSSHLPMGHPNRAISPSPDFMSQGLRLHRLLLQGQELSWLPQALQKSQATRGCAATQHLD